MLDQTVTRDIADKIIDLQCTLDRYLPKPAHVRVLFDERTMEILWSHLSVESYSRPLSPLPQGDWVSRCPDSGFRLAGVDFQSEKAWREQVVKEAEGRLRDWVIHGGEKSDDQ